MLLHLSLFYLFFSIHHDDEEALDGPLAASSRFLLDSSSRPQEICGSAGCNFNKFDLFFDFPNLGSTKVSDSTARGSYGQRSILQSHLGRILQGNHGHCKVEDYGLAGAISQQGTSNSRRYPRRMGTSDLNCQAWNLPIQSLLSSCPRGFFVCRRTG